MIKAGNISYSRGSKIILKDVSFSAGAGELLAIMGTNGAGKSTLLKMLSGELKPTAGKVFYEDKNLSDWDVTHLARLRAVLGQQNSLTLPFTVMEVVMMGRYPHFKMKEAANDVAAVHDALEKTGMTHLAQRSYTELSGGEQQRVQLARVFAQLGGSHAPGSRYLLLDEPVNSLDIRFQHDTLKMASEFARQGNTVVVILHDLNLAAEYADRILLLKNGSIVALDTPKKVITSETVTSAFGFPARVENHPYLDCPVVYFGRHTVQENTEEAVYLNDNF